MANVEKALESELERANREVEAATKRRDVARDQLTAAKEKAGGTQANMRLAIERRDKLKNALKTMRGPGFVTDDPMAATIEPHSLIPPLPAANRSIMGSIEKPAKAPKPPQDRAVE